jgi:type I restriction-modification system DNA methylase subunit
MITEIKNNIHNLVEKYESNRDYYRSSKFNETEVRSQFLDPLFEILGWDIRNTSGKLTNEREVLLEEPLRANALTHSKKPDYTFRLFGERKFFLEAKKPCVRIDIENEPAKQVRRYGYTAGLKISVLSNFEDLYIYDTSRPVEDNDPRIKSLVKSYHYTDYEIVAEELLQLLGKDAVYNGDFEEKWKDISLNVNYLSVDKLFLKQINEWRLLLGKEILKAIPDIEIEYLGDVVQSYINKILFLRVCEDRNIETYQSLLQIADRNSHQELIVKFKAADSRYNSGLFKEKLSGEIIGNVSSSFWTIIRKLYYPQSPYSFAVLSSDILGKIYEIFLSQRLAVVDGQLSIVNKPENEDRDIVTTPNFIVREILRQTIKDNLANLTDNQIQNLKCADIACGSGAFLLETFQLLCDALVDFFMINDRSKLIQTDVNTYKLKFEIKRNVLTKCIYGVDKDFNAVEACKFGLLLKLLEGEDESTIATFHPILPNLDENVFYGNSLLEASDVPSNQTEDINPFDFGERKFDFIVGNPPYMKTEDIKEFTPKEHKLYPRRYKSAYKQYDKYFLFIERAFKLLKENGTMGYIVPNKFMKVGAGKELRKFLSTHKAIKAITSFGAHQVFSDKSTYSCIIVLQNKENDSFKYSEIDSLSKWRVRDLTSFSETERNVSLMGEDPWILCSDRLQSILNHISAQSSPLGEIVGDDNIFNGIQTSANKVYIFQPESEDRQYYYFKYNNQPYQVEKKVTKPYFKTVSGDDSLNTYRTFKPNARVMFPYKKKANGKLNVIKLSTIQRKYPYFYNYLTVIQPELDRPDRDIKPTPTTINEWHRFGRHQSLEACEITEKIIVGVLALENKYAVDTNGTLVSSGGTAGYCLVSIPADSQYSIYYIQAILGSIQGEWLASLYGEIFRGGFIARGTKVLKQIPVRTIDFNNPDDVALHNEITERQKSLISLGDRIATAGNNTRKSTPLKRQFELLKAEQQQANNKLYGMTNDEVTLIPKIKELYAAD